MSTMRADLLLVARGLAATRAQAQAAIEAGAVFADGEAVRRASQMLHEAVTLEFTPAHPWASRAGVKLAHALAQFGIDPRGKVCLDIGSSTGGFTDVLLTNGAARVYAIDVGRDQLISRLKADARVVSLEALDARRVTREQVPEPIDLIVCDASFIGLAKILPAPLALAAPHAVLLALIKPQFESGPRRGETISVEDAARIADAVAAELDGLEGFRHAGLIQSPIYGGAGAMELLYFAKR
jgi:23S rRNA (cytidine1920-2'-O)/16S rRNA (cytidine1409-2'-O)-methyltransferase